MKNKLAFRAEYAVRVKLENIAQRFIDTIDWDTVFSDLREQVDIALEELEKTLEKHKEEGYEYELDGSDFYVVRAMIMGIPTFEFLFQDDASDVLELEGASEEWYGEVIDDVLEKVANRLEIEYSQYFEEMGWSSPRLDSSLEFEQGHVYIEIDIENKVLNFIDEFKTKYHI